MKSKYLIKPGMPNAPGTYSCVRGCLNQVTVSFPFTLFVYISLFRLYVIRISFLIYTKYSSRTVQRRIKQTNEEDLE